MTRIPGQIILRPTSDAGRFHAIGLLEVPVGALPSEHVMILADVGQGLHLLAPATPRPTEKAAEMGLQKLGDIGFASDVWYIENSLTEGQLYFRTMTAPASREGCELVAFSGTLRLRGGALPALNVLHEVLINPATMAFDLLSAPQPYAPEIANWSNNPADTFFGLPIWGFGVRPIGIRSTFPADVILACDRAQELMANELDGALSEADSAELAALITGPAGWIVGPVNFAPERNISFGDDITLAFAIRGLDGMRLAGGWTAEGFQQQQALALAMAEKIQANVAARAAAPEPEVAVVH